MNVRPTTPVDNTIIINGQCALENESVEHFLLRCYREKARKVTLDTIKWLHERNEYVPQL